MPVTDLELLARYTETQDAEAFAELVRRHRDMIYATCYRVSASAVDAEDAAQECFLYLARSAGSIQASVGGWLHRVAVRTATAALQKDRSRQKREEEAATMAMTPDEVASWDEIKPEVDRAIDRLPDALRQPLVLHFLEGRDQAAIAAELKLSQSAVSRRIKKAVDQVRKHLSEKGIVVSTAVLATLLTTEAGGTAPATLVAALGRLTLAGIPPLPVPPPVALTGAARAAIAGWQGKAVCLIAAAVVGNCLYRRATREDLTVSRQHTPSRVSAPGLPGLARVPNRPRIADQSSESPRRPFPELRPDRLRRWTGQETRSQPTIPNARRDVWPERRNLNPNLTRRTPKMERTIKAIAVAGLLTAAPVAHTQPPEQPAFAEQVRELLRRGDYPTALTLIVDALTLYPEAQTPRSALEAAFETSVMKGQTKELEKSLRDWTRREPKKPAAHTWLGAALATQEGREKEAEECYERALKLDPKWPDAHFRLAALGQAQGRLEAQAQWQRFLELEPDSDRATQVRNGWVVVRLKPVTKDRALHPAWSPDGKRLAFTLVADDHHEVHILHLGSGERTPLTTDGWTEAPSWSPDGRTIYLRRIPDIKSFETHVYARPWPEAGPEQNVTPEPFWNEFPHLSPDGRRLVFSGRSRYCYVVDVKSHAPTIWEHMVYQPSWSADGRSILFAQGEEMPEDTADKGLWRWNEETAAKQCLVPIVKNIACGHPRESPNGRNIVFCRTTGSHSYPFITGGPWQLWAMAASGQDPVRLMSCEDSLWWGVLSDWSPDGHQLAFHGGLFLWVATFGGLDPHLLKLEALSQKGGLRVLVTSLLKQRRTVTLTYQVFDDNSVEVAEGRVVEPDLVLQPEAVTECPLVLDSAREPGIYTVKLAAVTEKGEREVELVDYTIK